MNNKKNGIFQNTCSIAQVSWVILPWPWQKCNNIAAAFDVSAADHLVNSRVLLA